MIEFSFLLNSCLDIFEIRRKQTSIDQDLGLLHAIDERLAAYGWLTTTGVKLLIIVDLFGQEAAGKPAGPAVSGLRDSDLKPVCGGSLVRIQENQVSLIISARLFEHCRLHTSSSCKIPSIHQMIIRPYQELQQARCLIASLFLTQGLLLMFSVLVKHGSPGAPSRKCSLAIPLLLLHLDAKDYATFHENKCLGLSTSL